MINEKFLQYVWKYQLFDSSNLKTSHYQNIEIIHSGYHNTDSGPDFFNAKIKIDDTIWAGNVEIHLKSSDWIKHKHHNDNAYNNVILHVVYEKDIEIRNHKNELIPCLKLNIEKNILNEYNQLISRDEWPYCTPIQIAEFELKMFLTKQLIEKIEQKSILIKQTLQHTNNHWEESFYIILAKSFGFNTNSLPFELLAKSISLKTLSKHRASLFQLEALLFGQSGFLETISNTDEYGFQLQKEYKSLQKKYKLKPLDKSIWKFLRLRPNNFPTIRISQFAFLIYSTPHLFSNFIKETEVSKLQSYLNIQSNKYWDTHSKFGKESKFIKKKLGKNSMNLIILNAVLPFSFYYHKQINQEDRCEKVLELYEQIPVEKNFIIEQWEKHNVKADNAYYSQALINLKKEYCDQKKCLNCVIGNQYLLKRAKLI